MLRTHTCSELSEKDIGKAVKLCGWVGSRRDHGSLIFIDLRDAYGVTQIVFDPKTHPAAHKEADGLRGEFVIRVEGAVESRPEGTSNDKIPTGKIEVRAQYIEILNKSLTPPFEITDVVPVGEETKLKYRYLDIRRPAMQKNLRLRHKVCKLARDYFDERGFIEVETPILTKSTPEGARDYLVPSRLNPGMFYALPQSPQIFKEAIGADLKTPFPGLKYADAMSRFGCDKPDTRFGLELVEITDIVKASSFKVFQEAVKKDG